MYLNTFIFTNFIPKTFIIIIFETNYFKLVLKNVSSWDSNLDHLNYESSTLLTTPLFKLVNVLFILYFNYNQLN